jgi:hypothetical protein
MSYTLTPAERRILDKAERINAKLINTNRSPPRPVQQAMAALTPVVGDNLTVKLPGEIMRCKVDRVIDENRVIVEISTSPMARTHHYRMGDRTGARRRLEYGAYVWEALDDRDFIANRSPTEFSPVPTVNPLPPKAPPKKVTKTAVKAAKAKKGTK